MGKFYFADKVTFVCNDQGTERNALLEINHLFFIARTKASLIETRTAQGLELTPFGKIIEAFDSIYPADDKAITADQSKKALQLFRDNIKTITQTTDAFKKEENIQFDYAANEVTKNKDWINRIDIHVRENLDHWDCLENIVSNLTFAHQNVPVRCLFKDYTITVSTAMNSPRNEGLK